MNQSLELLKLGAVMLINSIKYLAEIGVSPIYKNQYETANKIVECLINPEKILILVVGMMQSGKTGVISAVIEMYQNYCLNNNTNPIPVANIFVITGASSVDWCDQITDRLPHCLRSNVFHRNQLNQLLDKIKGMTDVLIFIDECQVACQSDQSVSQLFKKAGFTSLQFLQENRIRIIEISATPDGTLYDAVSWGKNSEKIFMEPGDGYVSVFHFLQESRVFQYSELLLSEKQMRDPNLKFRNLMAFKEINDVIKTRFENMQFYHIIRTPNGDKKSNRLISKFKKFFGDNYEYKRYDQDSEIKQINCDLEIPPKKHTFIFIKEKLRYSKTLYKQYLGILYDRYTKNPLDSVILQSLIGRACGYFDNGYIVVFTNIESIKKYKKLWESEFQDRGVKWRSNSTKINKNNLTISKDTVFKPETFGIIRDDNDDNTNENEPIIEKFNNWQDARSFVLKNIPKTIDKINKNPKNIDKIGPQNPFTATDSKMKDGFLECTIRTNRKVYSLDELWCERKCNIDNGAGYSFKYGYKDLCDPESIEFWILYKT